MRLEVKYRPACVDARGMIVTEKHSADRGFHVGTHGNVDGLCHQRILSLIAKVDRRLEPLSHIHIAAAEQFIQPYAGVVFRWDEVEHAKGRVQLVGDRDGRTRG